jgi:HD-GYP domain-containing protein (c-di-GMP phosphodiesterase class II)
MAANLDTGSHMIRIRVYTRIIAEELAVRSAWRDTFTPQMIEDLSVSSMLHDIGKAAIPHNILAKTGKLSRNVKIHTILGGVTLSETMRKGNGAPYLKMAREICYYHHEKWDGTGYPFGLKGARIPLSARIIAIADVYDALTSPRSYKKAFSHDYARLVIRTQSKRHFDPEVVDAFLEREKEFMRVLHKRLADAEPRPTPTDPVPSSDRSS